MDALLIYCLLERVGVLKFFTIISVTSLTEKKEPTPIKIKKKNQTPTPIEDRYLLGEGGKMLISMDIATTKIPKCI